MPALQNGLAAPGSTTLIPNPCARWQSTLPHLQTAQAAHTPYNMCQSTRQHGRFSSGRPKVSTTPVTCRTQAAGSMSVQSHIHTPPERSVRPHTPLCVIWPATARAMFPCTRLFAGSRQSTCCVSAGQHVLLQGASQRGVAPCIIGINRPTAADRHVTCADPSHTAAEKAGRQSYDVSRGPLPGAHAAVPVTTGGKGGAGLATLGRLAGCKSLPVHECNPVTLVRHCVPQHRQYCTKPPRLEAPTLSLTSYPTQQQLDKA